MAWLGVRTPPDAVRRPVYEITALPGPATPTENRVPAGGLRLTSVVERFRTTKDLADPVGTFELTCNYDGLPGMAGPVSQVLIPGNIVDIQLDAGLPETTLEMVMRGYVVSVEESETLDGRGKPVRSISVSGYDCGGWFKQHAAPLYLYTAYSHGDDEWRTRVQALSAFGGSIGQCLRHCFVAVFSQVAPITAVVEDGQLLTEPILDNVDDGSEDYWPASVEMMNLDQINGQFWSTFMQYADPPWVETFGDYIPNPATSAYAGYTMATLKGGGVESAPASGGGAGYYLIARRTPYSQGRWSTLPTTVLFDSEVKLARTRFDDSTRVNMTYCEMGGQGFEGTAQIPIWGADARYVHRDEDSMKRYGTRIFQRKSMYEAFAGDSKDPAQQTQYAAGQGDWSAMTVKRSDALWRWFSINHLLRSGVIVIAGIPSIRIGERVTGQGSGIATAYLVGDEQIRRDWYVSRVVHDYTDGGAFLTNLAVVRGQPQGGFLTALTDAMLTNFGFTGIDWTKVSNWHPPMQLPSA